LEDIIVDFEEAVNSAENTPSSRTQMNMTPEAELLCEEKPLCFIM